MCEPHPLLKRPKQNPQRADGFGVLRTFKQGDRISYMSQADRQPFVPWETDRLMCWNDARPLLRRAS